MKRLFSFFMLALFISFSISLFGNIAQAKPAFEQYGKIVDADFVSQYAVTPKRKDVMIIDARPTRKYDKGHIVPAINITFSKIEQSIALLPEDKSTLLIYYCGGLKCPLSHKSHFGWKKLGYTNIAVYAAGYPDWLKHGKIPGVSTTHVKKLIDKKANAVIIDARPARKYKKGHVPTAISIPYSKFDQMLGQLPTDKGKLILYYCGGYRCPLSSKSAVKAIEQGYTNVKLYQAGWPAWKAAYGIVK